MNGESGGGFNFGEPVVCIEERSIEDVDNKFEFLRKGLMKQEKKKI